MDAELFAESVEYERLAQAVFQAVLRPAGRHPGHAVRMLYGHSIEEGKRSDQLEKEAVGGLCANLRSILWLVVAAGGSDVPDSALPVV